MQAKGPPKLGPRPGTAPSPAPPEGSRPCRHLDLGLPASACDKFLLFEPLCLWFFVTAAPANYQIPAEMGALGGHREAPACSMVYSITLVLGSSIPPSEIT